MFHVRMYDQLCFNYVCFHMVWLILGYLNFSSTRFIIKVVIRGSVIQPEQNFLSETMLVVKFVAGSKERVTYLHCPVEINLYRDAPIYRSKHLMRNNISLKGFKLNYFCYGNSNLEYILKVVNETAQNSLEGKMERNTSWVYSF